MRDPRVDDYARLLVGRCVGVRPGWEVLIRATPLARPLVEAMMEEIARRDAEPILQLAFELVGGPVAREAPLERLRAASPLQRALWAGCDAIITVYAPESTREGADLSEERRQAFEQRLRPLRARTMAMEVPWVVCEYPVQSIAQDAGMTLAAFEEFVFGAVLLDWDAEAEKMRRIADRFDETSEVRIVGDGTDLTLSIEGRAGEVDDGHVNMPGGEVFYAPVEDSAEGVITFAEFPAVRFGREVVGARLVFEAGRVVEASAASDEAFLHEMLASDDGASRLGELGLGCNPMIQRFTKNLGFDEKIDGTIHLALGSSYSFIGGRNVSAIHWDIVKDLRERGELYADGRLVQESGRWLL
jgi:aminopeptidase